MYLSRRSETSQGDEVVDVSKGINGYKMARY